MTTPHAELKRRAEAAAWHVILPKEQVLQLIEENERMREAGDKLFRAFSNPITRRQLGGHDERQMEAVLSWREATKPSEASHD